jgi:CHAT domain-containing protein
MKARLALAILAFSVSAAAAEPTVVNPPGTYVERALDPGETHIYRVDLKAGDRLFVWAGQRSVDLSLRIAGPSGVLAEVDDQKRDADNEMVVLVVPGDGEHLIQVSTAASARPQGGYDAMIDILTPGAPEADRTIAALTAYFDAERQRLSGKLEARLAARTRYAEALALWQGLGDRLREAKAEFGLGAVARVLGEHAVALEHFTRAAEIYQQIEHARGETQALAARCWQIEQLGEKTRALECLSDVLPRYRALGHRAGEAYCLQSRSRLNGDIGRYQEALDDLHALLPIARERGDKPQEIDVLNTQGVVYERMGRHQEALDAYAAATLVAKVAGDREGLSYLLNNVGVIHRLMGDADAALSYFDQAHVAAEGFNEPWNRANRAVILANIGVTHQLLGNLGDALRYYAQSLAVSRAIPDRAAEGITLQQVGFAQEKRGDLAAAAAAHEEAIRLLRSVEDNQRAADTLRSLGDVRQAQGELDAALALYAQALPEQRQIGDRKAQAATLYGMARARREKGDLGAARADIEAALAIVEEIRGDIVSESLKASYLGSTRDYYDLQIDILMRLGREEEAFQASERARARALLDTLFASRAEVREGVSPDLLRRETEARGELARAVDRLAQAPQGAQSGTARAEAQVALEEARAELSAVTTRIRAESPRYAALTQPAPLRLEEIQRNLLDADTVLLEYALGEKRSFVWAVSREGVISRALPPRAELERAAREFYEALSKQQLRTPTGALPAAYRRTAEALARLVLEPVAAELGRRRILVVSEGTLQFTPFAALPSPGATGFAPLVTRHEVVHLPSASVLGTLRGEAASRRTASRTVAIVADPVFSRDDPRVSGTAGRAPVADAVVLRSAAQSGITEFARLAESRREADRIAALTPAAQTLKAVDFDASLQTVREAGLEPYRIVHFATHGLLNSQRPELSGLVLSLVDRKGEPQSGFLRLHDVYNLRLAADLVVLSACQTALGKNVHGEGLLGLTRGFMYAGAPRVVASLWKVDDRATAELMTRFYRNLIGKGQPAASALRAAQLSMLAEPRWNAPQHWAGFVLQGEWR